MREQDAPQFRRSVPSSPDIPHQAPPSLAETIAYRSYPYHYLSYLLEYQLPPKTSLSILNKLDIFAKRPDGHRHLEIFEQICTSEGSADLARTINRYLEPGETLAGVTASLARQPVIKEIMAGLGRFVQDQEDFLAQDLHPSYQSALFALATLASQLPYHELPKLLRDQFSSHKQVEWELLPAHRSWWLCDDAEPRFEKATSHPMHGVVLVDDALLVKVSHGKLSALCLSPVVTPNGLFIPGVWYSPIDEESRRSLVVAYEEGQTRLSLPKTARWALMRPLKWTEEDDSSPREFFDAARTYAEGLPQHLPKDVQWNSGWKTSRRHARYAEDN
jgi:hypothetical protein